MVLNGVGRGTSFISLLFGISAQRGLTKLTGYIPLLCWWSAFFPRIFI
ncbi:MAG: hypothetical protein ACFE8N_12915 [Promethearchaeota archaeon]